MNEKEEQTLQQLITLSHTLGNPSLDYIILGEGNTSTRADQDTFWVKGSGSQLRTIEAEGFVRVVFSRILETLDGPDLDDEQIKKCLEASRADPRATRMPSVETFLHALALKIEGVNFVGHTHPVAVNSVMCSQEAEKAIRGRLFPDEIVVCGPAPVFVPYVDPGLPLARTVRDAIQKYLDDYGQAPKVILMQNHGMIALGKNPAEVENITAMEVKACRVLQATYALGGPRFMTQENVDRIHKRPDELYRRKVWGVV